MSFASQRQARTMDERERCHLTAWAKAESKSRTVGPGSSAVHAAVTGHGRPKVRAGKGPPQAAPPTASGSGSSTRPTRKSSILSKVSDRSDRFA